MKKQGKSSNGTDTISTLLFYSTSILFILYGLVTLRTFLALPEIPSDFLVGLNQHPQIRSQSDILNAIKKAQDPYRFPQSIKEETLEEIDHPGIVSFNALHPEQKRPVSKLSVPRFWSPPQGREALTNGGNLMTKEAALGVGSKITYEGIELETIFAAVASYRDYQCPQTVASLFSRAKYPQRIRVAVNDQIDKSDDPCIPRDCSRSNSALTDHDVVICQYLDQIDVYTMEAEYAIGPVFARHIGHRLYRGEYFAMQLDAHVDFVNNWDVDIVSQWKSARNEMTVLTAYLSDIEGSIEKNGDRKRDSRPIMCESDFEGSGRQSYIRHGQQPEGVPGIHGEPTLEPYWAAGFSFARGHFVVNVPYDQHLPMIFQGEEISIGMRGWTYGYDFYTPEKSICFHWYAHGDHIDKRKNVKLFWEHANLYQGAGRRSMFRSNGIIKMNPPTVKDDEWDHSEIDKYGLGKVRKPEQFFKIFGIHMDTRTVEHHLCRFVGRSMQKMFVPHLRENGMGIDYDKIVFEWKDPDPAHRTRD